MHWFKASAANIFYWWISVGTIAGGPQAFLNNYSVDNMERDVVYGFNTVRMYENYKVGLMLLEANFLGSLRLT